MIKDIAYCLMQIPGNQTLPKAAIPDFHLGKTERSTLVWQALVRGSPILSMTEM